MARRPSVRSAWRSGIIGLEVGSVWNRLGSEVVILEALDDFLAAVDRDVAKEAQKQFKKQELTVHLGAKVTGAKESGTAVKVEYEKRSRKQSLEVDRLVVAVGRTRRHSPYFFAKFMDTQLTLVLGLALVGHDHRGGVG